MYTTLELSIEEWDSLADNVHDYLVVKTFIESGHEVVLKDEVGIKYAYLKVDEFDRLKYIYKGLID